MKNVKDENIEPKMLEEINKILEDKTLSFFPKSGEWGGYCFGRPKEVGYGYLPCHLRDSKWLAKLLYQISIIKTFFILFKLLSYLVTKDMNMN